MSGRIHPLIAALVLDGLEAVGALTAAENRAVPRDLLEGVPLAPYRAALRQAEARGGRRALLASGAFTPQARHPFLFVLLNSDHPRVLVEKEARLGRYIHSRHRVALVDESPDGIVLEHRGRPAPDPLESLAACGQHAALFGALGCQGLTVAISGEPLFAAGTWREPPAGATHRWDFRWSALVPTRQPMDGLDALLLSTADERPLRDSGTTERVRALVERDPGRNWTVARVADALGLSARTLQRRLKGERTGVRELLDQARIAEAERLLARTALTVTVIGYIAGFADTAHFNRRFRHHHQCSPGAWRAQQAGA